MEHAAACHKVQVFVAHSEELCRTVEIGIPLLCHKAMEFLMLQQLLQWLGDVLVGGRKSAAQSSIIFAEFKQEWT